MLPSRVQPPRCSYPAHWTLKRQAECLVKKLHGDIPDGFEGIGGRTSGTNESLAAVARNISGCCTCELQEPGVTGGRRLQEEDEGVDMQDVCRLCCCMRVALSL